MKFKGLFKKKLSIKQGKRLLTAYCELNGFDDDNTQQWKKITHDKHLFAYHKRSNLKIVDNWVAYHLTRGNNRYSIWIYLVI